MPFASRFYLHKLGVRTCRRVRHKLIHTCYRTTAVLTKVFRAEVLHDFDAERSRSVMHLMAGKRLNQQRPTCFVPELVAGGFYHLSHTVLCVLTICVT